jgi:hypothetical protein
VLKKTVGPESKEVTGEWRRLYNKDPQHLYPALSIVQVIKSRRNIWAGHVVRIGRRKVHTGGWWGNERERDDFEDPGIDWRIIVKLIL